MPLTNDYYYGDSVLLPDSMTALVLDASGGYTCARGFEKRQVQAPRLDDASASDQHSVILKVLYAGFCGSDKGLWYRNAFDGLVMPALKREGKDWRVPGHECLGQIVAMGPRVSSQFDYKVGDVVAAESHLFCGECYQCKRGQQHVCKNTEIIGFTCDGCFAEYIKLPAKVLWPTNLDKVRPEVAAMQEPFGNAVHVCTKVDLKDKSVLISGCGTIGLFCFLIAKQLGAKKIIGIDPLPRQLELAKTFGADETIVVPLDKSKDAYKSVPSIVEKIHQATDGVGVDVAMEMAGFNVSLNNAIQATRRGGDVILFGIKSGDFTLEHYSDLVLSGKNFHGIIGRHVFETWEHTTRLLENHPDEIQAMIYKHILNDGDGTIVSLNDFDPQQFANELDQHIKLVLHIANPS